MQPETYYKENIFSQLLPHRIGDRRCVFANICKRPTLDSRRVETIFRKRNRRHHSNYGTFFWGAPAARWIYRCGKVRGYSKYYSRAVSRVPVIQM